MSSGSISAYSFSLAPGIAGKGICRRGIAGKGLRARFPASASALAMVPYSGSPSRVGSS